MGLVSSWHEMIFTAGSSLIFSFTESFKILCSSSVTHVREYFLRINMTSCTKYTLIRGSWRITLGAVIFFEKKDSVQWDWSLLSAKQYKMGMGLEFKQDRMMGFYPLVRWNLVKFGKLELGPPPPARPSTQSDIDSQFNIFAEYFVAWIANIFELWILLWNASIYTMWSKQVNNTYSTHVHILRIKVVLFLDWNLGSPSNVWMTWVDTRDYCWDGPCRF